MTNGALRGRIFIVTGAGGAIADAVNRALLTAGADLALADRPGSAEGARERLGTGLAVPTDLSSPDGAKAMVEATLAAYGRLDGLVHTVGGFRAGKVGGLEHPLEDYAAMMDLNVRTLVNATVACLPALSQSEHGFLGAIAAGQAARGEGGGSALYTAAKGAVALFLKSLDAELSGSSLRVGVVYPMGSVDTPANRASMPDADPETWIDPAEIGAAFVYMASRSGRGRVREVQVFGPRPGR